MTNIKSSRKDKERHRDVCVQTEVIEPSVSDSSSSSSSQVEDCREKNSHQETEVREHGEKLRDREVCEIVDQNHVGKKIEEGEKKGNNWWRDGGQTILQFFAKILGKRGGMCAKGGMTDRVLPGGKQQRVKRVSRGGGSHNGHIRDVDRGIRLRRVNNGYIVNHVCRDEGNGGDLTKKNKSREEQHYPSILVRQIQRTRDKNLRVLLLERELRLRSSKIVKENKTRLVPDEAVRQLSSPLC
ncbi:uncharacterized protein LOC109852918 isoform X2 [Pseudomyrmex gracilis]|uniref:uncharacterized protein LOC109852918 isoform X2 n=1 Tax=Pseudomyrmex gracilis TaxID=219809 RepID=UPI000994F32B|nr:uncharacterized protein LOC109852918 isoform X2 [Pseudomyrmex gracilis]